jgi:hypothetical protein
MSAISSSIQSPGSRLGGLAALFAGEAAPVAVSSL